MGTALVTNLTIRGLRNVCIPTAEQKDDPKVAIFKDGLAVKCNNLNVLVHCSLPKI